MALKQNETEQDKKVQKYMFEHKQIFKQISPWYNASVRTKNQQP